MPFTQYDSELRLAEAFDALFDFVAGMSASDSTASVAPEFTYLLTQRQLDEVNRICEASGWPIINCWGIHIDINAIRHPIDARSYKDSIGHDEIKAIIRKAYSPRSMIRRNKHASHDHQALIFNTHQKIKIGSTSYHGMAVLEVRTQGARNYLAPVTCYHATEAKVRAIK